MASIKQTIKWSYAFQIWLSLIITTLLVGGIIWAVCAATFTFMFWSGMMPDFSNTDIRSFIKGTFLLACVASQVYAIKLVMTQRFKNFEIKIIEK